MKEMFGELNDNLQGFTPVIDESTGKITGYKTAIGGADTVFPFSKTLLASPEKYIVNYNNGHGTGDTLYPSFSGFEVGKRYFFVANCASVQINCEWKATVVERIYFGVFIATSSSLSPFLSSAYVALNAKVFEL